MAFYNSHSLVDCRQLLLLGLAVSVSLFITVQAIRDSTDPPCSFETGEIYHTFWRTKDQASCLISSKDLHYNITNIVLLRPLDDEHNDMFSLICHKSNNADCQRRVTEYTHSEIPHNELIVDSTKPLNGSVEAMYELDNTSSRRITVRLRPHCTTLTRNDRYCYSHTESLNVTSDGPTSKKSFSLNVLKMVGNATLKHYTLSLSSRGPDSIKLDKTAFDTHVAISGKFLMEELIDTEGMVLVTVTATYVDTDNSTFDIAYHLDPLPQCEGNTVSKSCIYYVNEKLRRHVIIFPMDLNGLQFKQLRRNDNLVKTNIRLLRLIDDHFEKFDFQLKERNLTNSEANVTNSTVAS